MKFYFILNHPKITKKSANESGSTMR